MKTKVLRKVIRIDEDKCDGCGACVPACAEGALQIVDGKAKIISEKYCDGLGACLGECPQGAITIEERVAEGFDEEAVKHHLETKEHVSEDLPCGCPSSMVTQFDRQEATGVAPGDEISQQSMLAHWPVQLTLVPPTAPFLQGADLVLAADCVPFAYAGFHHDFLQGHALLVACPKLDDFQAHLKKLANILRHSDVKSLTVVHMEVPCCSELAHMAKQAIRLSGKDIPFSEVTIGIKGDLKSGAKSPHPVNPSKSKFHKLSRKA
ncbi:MAG: 4Fe-4S ferredoxin [Dehalococcoidia bacterium]|nr:4Fe-4S ferredoxin [Dehalococcoidia bacterium]